MRERQRQRDGNSDNLKRSLLAICVVSILFIPKKASKKKRKERDKERKGEKKKGNKER